MGIVHRWPPVEAVWESSTKVSDVMGKDNETAFEGVYDDGGSVDDTDNEDGASAFEATLE